MDIEIFRKYEHDLFDKDSMFIQYSNDPTHFTPPIGYVPRTVAQSLWQEPSRTNDSSKTNGSSFQNKDSTENENKYGREWLATDYDIDLASRAYDRLYANREFSFHGMKAELVEEYLISWKSRTMEVLQYELEAESMEKDEEQGNVELANVEMANVEVENVEKENLGIDDFYLDFYESDKTILDVNPKWSGSGESVAQDLAWIIWFADRKFDLEELRPEFRIKEIARWRAEIVRLNKEDHQKYGPEQTVNALNELLSKEVVQEKIKDFGYDDMNKLLDELEKSWSLETGQKDQKDLEQEIDSEILDFRSDSGLLEVREDPPKDFGRILLGEESQLRSDDSERGLEPSGNRFEWELLDPPDKSDDHKGRFGHNQPNERDEQQRKNGHGDRDGHSR